MPNDSAPLTRAWLLLAVAALGVSALAAVVLGAAGARLGPFGEVDVLRRALAMHAVLAQLGWVLAMAAAVWSTRAGEPGAAAWVAVGAGSAGLSFLLVSPFVAHRALPDVYLPALDHPLFLLGLLLFGAGVVLAGLTTLAAPGPAGKTRTPLRWLDLASVLAVVAVAAAAAASFWSVPAGLPRAHFIDAVAWGPGHVLQMAYPVLLLLVWAELARRAGLLDFERMADRRLVVLAVLLAVLPFLLLPRLYIQLPLHLPESRQHFAEWVVWGSWPAPLLFLLGLARRWRGARDGGLATAGLAASMALLLVGAAVGMLSREGLAPMAVPVHGMAGALSVALLALAHRFGDGLGMPARSRRAAYRQLGLVGGGMLLLAVGSAWGGGPGALRGLAALPGEAFAWTPAMVLAGLGGAAAILGVADFVWQAARRWLVLPHAWQPGGRGAGVALATAALLLAGGTGIAWQSPPADTTRVLAEHAQAAKETEVRQRFAEGVTMLNERQFERAMTAFHRVLALAPALPEAHVNMGFALVGAGHHKAAGDFFDAALKLNPRQLNAYYGLALALEGVGDVGAAVQAMRTFVHLSPRDDPYVQKAEAALWDWETRRDGVVTVPPGSDAGR